MNLKHSISDFILRRAEQKAHYETCNLPITNFESGYDLLNPHDLILYNLQMSFYNQRYDFLKKHITTRSKILEIGDVNGFNIEQFGTNESLSINFVDYSKNINNNFQIMNVNNGIKINEQYEYGMMFETLEHTHNPMLILNQLLNLCEKGVFISIPYVEKTTTKLDLNGGHVFEFSPKDLTKIFKHYNIIIKDYNKCNVLKLDFLTKIFKIHSILHKHLNELFGIFENFQLYYLQKEFK